MKHFTYSLVAVFLLSLGGCSSMYYSAMEKFGIEKRELLQTRVQAAKNSQEGAREQFVSASEQFRNLLNFKGGDLEKVYNTLSSELAASEKAAEKAKARVGSVEKVGDAMFSEWEDELTTYSSESLRRSSRLKMESSKAEYKRLLVVMKEANNKINPVLAIFRDQVLYLKHNLNAQALSGMRDDLASFQTEVEKLISSMELSIKRAEEYLATYQS